MTIDTIDENRIKIDLTDDEIYLLFGGYEKIDYSNEQSKRTLNLLFKKAVPSDEFPLDCRKLLIEVKPITGGCSIYVTKIYKDKPRRYKRVNIKRNYILSFIGSENMITGVCELNRNAFSKNVKSELYKFCDNYCVIINTDTNIDDVLTHIKEYCSDIYKSDIIASKVAEYGIAICREKAIQKIGETFKTT